MSWIIVGLGNPGEEYEHTRHNAGRMALMAFAKAHKLSEWSEQKKYEYTATKGAIGKQLFALVLPDTFMNKSGNAVVKFIKSQKAAEKLIVVYDDMDLPLGTVKLAFDRGSGGHRGLESIAKAVKTKKFTRVRIGVSPATAKGVAKKPKGEEAVLKFILAKFRPTETDELKKIFKRTNSALEAIVTQGPLIAMNEFNRG